MRAKRGMVKDMVGENSLIMMVHITRVSGRRIRYMEGGYYIILTIKLVSLILLSLLLLFIF